MYYSKTTGGFYDRELHGDNMPEDVVEIAIEAHAALLAAQSSGKRIAADAEGFPIVIDPPPPAPPAVVTMRQARLALLEAGKLGAITAAIAALPSPQKEAAQIEWEFAATVERSSAMVAMLSVALSLDEGQLDALFSSAFEL